MSEVHVKEEIAAPVQTVWEMLSDFGGVAKWSAAIESCEVEGDGVGAVRTLAMPGGLKLQERLESFDEDAKSFSYSIIEPCPLPFTNYVSEVRITEAGADRCTVDWKGRFEPSGDEEQAQKMVRGIYTGGIAAIKKQLEG